MAYNPFDDVILDDPAYMQIGGGVQRSVIPQRRVDASEQEPGFKPVASLIAGAYKLLTPEQETLDQIEKDQQLRSLATAQAFTGTEFEKFAGQFDLPSSVLQNQKALDLLNQAGFNRESFTEGISRAGQFLYGNQRQAFDKLKSGEQLTSDDRLSIALAPLDSLDFLLPPVALKKLAGIGLKNINQVLKSTSDLPEVRQVKQLFGGEPLPAIGRADGPPGMDTGPRIALSPADEGAGARKPPSRAGTQGAITTERFEKAKPVIENLSKQNPEGLSKPQVIEALSKTFPDLNANQLNSIYEGKRMVGGRMQNTFPFSEFMKKGAAAVGGETAKAASLQRIKEYDDFLAKNPPKKPIAPKAAENQVKQVSFDKKGARAEKITEYAKNNPNSAIAKFVRDPLAKAENQLTPEVLQTLKNEFEVFDDFIPIATAVRLTGIPETTLSRAVKKGTNGVDEFVQPQRAKGKKEAFIRSYIPGASPDQALDVQAKSLLTIDNFRGGLFGSTEQDFMKIMDEYGIIPKKIRSFGEFVDNPKYLKNDAVFEQRMARNREKFFEDQIKFLDRGQESFKDLQKMIDKRNQFGDYAKNLFKNTVRENPVLKKRFLEEYYRVLGKKFGGDEKLLDDLANYPDDLFEKQLSDIARAFAGNAAHVTPIARVKGRTPKRGDQFKLSPKLRGKFSNPEFYRVNLGVDNIGRQPRFENIIFKNIKIINNPKSSAKARGDALDRIAQINREMTDKNMSTLLEFSKKDLSPETVKKLQQQGTLAKALQSGDKKTTLFLGRSQDMSLDELQKMFADRLEKYIRAPELFKLSKQRPKGAKIEDEMFILGSAPYIVKGFPLDFKQGGAVRMAIGGDPLQNINQQQFMPDPAFEGEDFFKEAVDSGNLTAFNPTKLFKVFGKVDAVETPKKKIQTDAPQAPPGTTLPAAQQMQPSDFAFKSFTLDVITDPNAPKAARPQDWMNFFKGKAAPEAELRDTGLMQFLEDYAKYYPNQKLTQQRLVDFYEQSPMGNISIKVKQDGTNVPADPAFLDFVGRPRHKNTGNQDLDEVGENYREVLVQAGPLPGETKPFVASAHFQEENVIGFTRVADYENVNGQPVAVIQELQTDMLTQVRKEQERIQALLKRIENIRARAQRQVDSGDTFDSEMGKRALRELNSEFPTATIQKLQENLSAIKPFPNTAGLERVPQFSKELSDIQKQINALIDVEVKSPNPQTPFALETLENQQQTVLNNLLDLTRNTELETDLKGLSVPSSTETDELIRFGEKSDNMNTAFGGFKELQLFPPVPFNKQPDYVDLLVKATIKDAQSKGINKVAIMPAEKVNQRWGKDPDGPAGVKFKNLYDKVVPQQLNNIAKKYNGNVSIEQIVDKNKLSTGLKMTGKNVDGQFELLRDIVPSNREGADEFLSDEILRIVGDYGPNDVVVRREVAPGQTMEFFASRKKGDGTLQLTSLGDADRAENATIIIEEYNPQIVDMVTITLDSPKAEQPFFMFKKKDGGTIAKDSLVSVTDIFGEYGSR